MTGAVHRSRVLSCSCSWAIEAGQAVPDVRQRWRDEGLGIVADSPHWRTVEVLSPDSYGTVGKTNKPCELIIAT